VPLENQDLIEDVVQEDQKDPTEDLVRSLSQELSSDQRKIKRRSSWSFQRD